MNTNELVTALGTTGFIFFIVAFVSWIMLYLSENKKLAYLAVPATVLTVGCIIAATWVPVFW